MVLPTAMELRLVPMALRRDMEKRYHLPGDMAAGLRYIMVQKVDKDAGEAVHT